MINDSASMSTQEEKVEEIFQETPQDQHRVKLAQKLSAHASRIEPVISVVGTFTLDPTKLNKLDNIEARQTSMKKVERRMSAIRTSLAPLKDLPALVT
ncbi:hypothetical protein TSAR_002345 [Trichomalopsis sarcophagae]|uniref:Uncharacterized protein n=1 Tax=Trichomalopsis sarcophagae TaxID=543379 RepID=A0A232EGE0_9HYME|nr:hypothetical protein TSAR_002345 [Trichomalopsis sarcophagae]